jgi:hypothetical protein
MASRQEWAEVRAARAKKQELKRRDVAVLLKEAEDAGFVVKPTDDLLFPDLFTGDGQNHLAMDGYQWNTADGPSWTRALRLPPETWTDDQRAFLEWSTNWTDYFIAYWEGKFPEMDTVYDLIAWRKDKAQGKTSIKAARFRHWKPASHTSPGDEQTQQ